MPNHIMNILKIDATGNELQHILESIKNDEKGIGSIDFNKIIPMPQLLNIESGSRTKQGIELYKQFLAECAATSILSINNEDMRAAYENQLFEKYQKLKDEDSELFDLGAKYYDNLQKYGAGDWYEWSIANWGTKWNAYNFGYDNRNTLTFYTANSSPEAVMIALSQKFPAIAFSHDWADEDIGANVGQREYLRGEIVYGHIPDAFSKEAYDVAFGIWGEEPEDRGLMLNADGTEYISVEEAEEDEDMEI